MRSKEASDQYERMVAGMIKDIAFHELFVRVNPYRWSSSVGKMRAMHYLITPWHSNCWMLNAQARYLRLNCKGSSSKR